MVGIRLVAIPVALALAAFVALTDPRDGAWRSSARSSRHRRLLRL
jgi:hypothetical protein